MGVYEVRQYLTEDGKNPFLTWLKQVRDPIAKIQIIKRLNRLEQGNFGDVKFCRAGVWELRLDIGAGYRLYYAQAGSQIILLLCGGDKRTQATDIDRAVKHWQDWQRRPDDDER
jgi:putative addiction module killer protein